MHRRPNFITHWAPYKYCKIYQRWNFAPNLRGKVPPPYSVMRIKTHWIHHLTLHINLSDGYIALQRDSSILKCNLSTSLLQLLWVVPLEHKAVKDGNSDCAIVTKGFEALDRILDREIKKVVIFFTFCITMISWETFTTVAYIAVFLVQWSTASTIFTRKVFTWTLKGNLQK